MRTQRPLIDGWFIKQLETDTPDAAALMREATAPDATWLAARMPAQVHDILYAHGRIADPHVGTNAADSAWVGERDWAYACAFVSPPPAAGPVLLRFDGLDTLASAYLNGVPIGRFDNMFRVYQVDVGARLAPSGDENVLLLIFSSPLRFVQNVTQPPAHVGRLARHAYLRKPATDFGTYLGARPHAAKVGIYRDVTLDLRDRAWIEDVSVRCTLTPDLGRATVRVDVQTGGDGTGASLFWALADPAGREVAQGGADSGDGGFTIELDRPQLWWPWTHGTPHLYGLAITLILHGEALDVRRESVGIRDVRAILRDPATGEDRFGFAINGRPIFLRGANWAPVEGMTHCWRHERAMQLLDLAVQARMNLLRVWGGGSVPPAAFYDECDRRGLLVWQDFMFDCPMYPDGDAAFDDSCRAEVEGIVRALRNHACILLWVGGNESYMWWDFAVGDEPTIGRALFERIMPEVCAGLDPARPYHLNSPFGGPAPNWPLTGDWHDYTWRHYSHASSVPAFVSEHGSASAPSVASLRRFLGDEELWPPGHDSAIRTPGQAAWPPMWGYRSVDGAWEKVGPIEEFCDPASAEDLVRVLGTAHGEALRRNVERHRRGAPDGAPAGGRRCWGDMVWRLNDAWPILYYSVVDYYLAPKIAYYFLRRAYAPVLVCVERTLDRLAVWVVNDSPEAVAGVLTVRRQRFDGAVGGELAVDVVIGPGEARRCLDTEDLGPILLRHEFLVATFVGEEATYLLAGERRIDLPRADVRVRHAGGAIEVSTDVFARQVVLEAPGMPDTLFEDNYFDLAPGRTRTIAIPAGVAEVRARAYNGGRSP